MEINGVIHSRWNKKVISLSSCGQNGEDLNRLLPSAVSTISLALDFCLEKRFSSESFEPSSADWKESLQLHLAASFHVFFLVFEDNRPLIKFVNWILCGLKKKSIFLFRFWVGVWNSVTIEFYFITSWKILSW